MFRKIVSIFLLVFAVSYLFCADKLIVQRDCNLRETPTGKIIGQAKEGELLGILDVSGNYCFASGQGKNLAFEDVKLEGWIFMPYQKNGVITKAVTVRTKPDKAGEVLGQFISGTSVIITEVKVDWYKTSRGWIFNENIGEVTSEQSDAD